MKRLVLGAVLLLTGTGAFACQCDTPSAKEQFEQSEAVFTANVIDIDIVIQRWDSVEINGKKMVIGRTYDTIDIRQYRDTFNIMKHGPAYKIVKLRVETLYKGQADSVVTVITGMGTGDCGFTFSDWNMKFKTYFLVYATRPGKTKRDYLSSTDLYTDSCHRTGYAKNNKDLKTIEGLAGK